MFNKKIMNLFYALIVGPVLWALAKDKVDVDYKQYVIWLAVFIIIINLYCLFMVPDKEGMSVDTYGSIVHHIQVFDSSPGYDPPRLMIKPGDIVVWTNIGEVEHTITSDNGHFNSGYMKPGESFTVKFSNVGDYYYRCTYHKGWMVGLVTVG